MVAARPRVRFAELDQPRDVLRLEHQQAQHVVRSSLAAAQAPDEKPERARQIDFVFVGQLAEIQ
jgi:hypothetical protein